ncbi:MAG: cupin domain-containing protein [Tissierellia bacterium]|nr:cupin domain-containing protein [Tissierellia bacterium]
MGSKFTGNKIRVLRKSKNMSIKDLAEKSDLSTGLISQIERDLVSPSVNAMTRIVQALDSTMGEFFDEEFTKESPIIIKKDKRKEISVNDMHRVSEVLSPTDNRLIEMVLMRLGKHDGKGHLKLSSHEGEECGYIIQGRMTILIEDEVYELEAGDSFYFESTKPHQYVNYDDEECISIWAMTPPSY